MNLLARHVILRALLRWTAAVAFCVPLKHRPHARLRALGMLLPLLGLTYVLDPSAQSTSLHELQFSLLTLYVAFFVLLGMMIYACVEIDKKSALYCAVWSLLASQTAYECWHLVEVFFEWRGTPLDLRSLPVMLAQLIQALYNIVDSFFVGKYSETGLTALSIIYPVQLLMIALGVGTGVGINTDMAYYLGIGKKKKAEEVAGTGTPLGLILWIIFAAVC